LKHINKFLDEMNIKEYKRKLERVFRDSSKLKIYAKVILEGGRAFV
jgi:hypothetical protein